MGIICKPTMRGKKCFEESKDKDKPFSVVLDAGKPFEEKHADLGGVKKSLKQFYEQHKNDDAPYDVFVFEGETEITNSSKIQKLITDITGGG